MKKIILITLLFYCSVILFGQSNEIRKDSLIADVNSLFTNISEIHPNMYAEVSQKDFESNIQGIKSKITTETDLLDLYILVNKLVVKMKDGHTSLFFPDYLLKEPNVLLFPFPINIDTKTKSVKTIDDYTESGNTIPFHSSILSINGIKIKEIVNEMLKQINGEQDFYRIDRINYNFTQLLYAIYKKNNYQVEYLYNDSIYKKTVKGISYDKRYNRNQNSDRQKYVPYSLKTFTENNYAILEIRTFAIYNKKRIKEYKRFLDSTFTILKKKQIKSLIIDVRNNGGGSSQRGNELFQYISQVPFKQWGKTTIRISEQQKKYYKRKYNKIEKSPIGISTVMPSKLIRLKRNRKRFKGKIYLLQNHFTFSSASSFAWAFKYFKMGKVVGQETGGVAVCFGDIICQKLPYTKFSYCVSHKHFYQYGADDNDTHGTIPDYEIKSKDALNYTIDLIMNNKK